LHHGWLLAGKRGIGKAAFAIQAARELVAEEGVHQPAGSHPDIIILEPLPATSDDEKKREEGKPYQLKRNITVDQVRAVQQRLTTRPTLGRRRAIIVDPVDDLEKSAANALLKSLEEPPEGTYFLLVAHRLGRLLPTIRSRCRILQFPNLPAGELEAILLRHAPQVDAATRAAAIAAAGGSPGAALDFVELDLGRMHGVMQALAQKGDRDFVLRGKLADALGARPDRKRQLAAVELARAIVTERMPAAERAAIPALTHAHAELIRLAAQAPTYNYDPGLLMMEIGGLLASLALPREAAHG
jgi:DNA polymerase-3 subunit delta'